MNGKNACWVPGTDHASIATEAKVVAMLRERGHCKIFFNKGRIFVICLGMERKIWRYHFATIEKTGLQPRLEKNRLYHG
jgi:valyl-tRNA synthetase